MSYQSPCLSVVLAYRSVVSMQLGLVSIDEWVHPIRHLLQVVQTTLRIVLTGSKTLVVNVPVLPLIKARLWLCLYQLTNLLDGGVA